MSEHREAIRRRTKGEVLRDVLGEILAFYRRVDLASKVSVWTLGVVFSVALLTPVIAPHDPYTQNYDFILASPGTNGFWLGTDKIGRDVLTRLMYGARISLLVATVSVTMAILVGCPIGAVAGYIGGKVDEGLMRAMDVILSFPSLVFALALVAVFGPSVQNLILVIGIAYSPHYARLLRSTVLSVKEEPYVEAAVNTGLSDFQVLGKHVVPNSITPVIVQASFHIASAILLEASLSFLGLGVQPPEASWGIMIANGRTDMTNAPWLTILPGIAIMTVVLSFNLLGDALRDELDPHSVTNQAKN